MKMLASGPFSFPGFKPTLKKKKKKKLRKKAGKRVNKPQKDTNAVRFKADQTPKGTLDGKDFNFERLRITCLVKALCFEEQNRTTKTPTAPSVSCFRLIISDDHGWTDVWEGFGAKSFNQICISSHRSRKNNNQASKNQSERFLPSSGLLGLILVCVKLVCGPERER